MRCSPRSVARPLPGGADLPRASAEEESIPARRALPGILVLSAAVLLLEVALTRVFAVVLWSHLAPMVVGTALFGFGLSGLWAHFTGRLREPAHLCLAFAVGVCLLLVVVDRVPLELWNVEARRAELGWVALGMYLAALLIPFFAAGLAVVRLFERAEVPPARLYAADLAGAAVGTGAMVPLLPLVFGEGALVTAAAAGSLAAACLGRSRTLRGASLALAAGLAIASPWTHSVVSLLPHQTKREYNRDARAGRLLHTEWSALSRVDVAKMLPGIHRIWIDGGTNESAMFAHPDRYFGKEIWRRHSAFLPYFLKGPHGLGRVLIIGPAGGKEVYFALAGGARHVDAVEMDPGVVRVVSRRFDGFLRGLYRDPRVHLVNDEGRAFLRSRDELYDVIQSVNNYTPVALASGALNLSEAFLFTKEAFHEYLDHLSEGGLLAFHRGTTLRLAALAAEVLEERGVAEPGRRLAILAGEVPHFDTVLVKNGEFTADELARLREVARARGTEVLYLPGGEGGSPLYTEIVESPTRSALYRRYGVNLAPPTDDWPFLDHALQFGKRKLPPELPGEFHYYEKLKWWKRIPRGDLAYVAILGESAFFGLLLVGLPLSAARLRRGLSPRGGVLAYFGALGAAFIVVELCLMKHVVLFLGHPAYSISTVLVVLLAGAALGSGISQRIRRLRSAVACLIALLVAEAALAGWVFHIALGLGFAARVAVAAVLLAPLAVAMGIPFPAGLRRLKAAAPEQIPLAWGMNGYGTVVGSGLATFLAVFFGFRVTYLVACGLYALAAASFPSDLERLQGRGPDP
jgi:hypothetical protein